MAAFSIVTFLSYIVCLCVRFSFESLRCSSCPALSGYWQPSTKCTVRCVLSSGFEPYGCLQELGGLTGLRYYYSTALEALDFFAPLLERLFSRIGDAGDCVTMACHVCCSAAVTTRCCSSCKPVACCAVSWLLVRLIGRSLGLVYRGVRESLVPRQRSPVAKSRSPPKWA